MDILTIELYDRILNTITVITLVVQLYVLYLVEYKSAKSMWEYRYFLKSLMLWDMLFTFGVDTLVAPYTIPNLFAGYFTGLAKYFRPEIQLCCLSLGFYFGAMVISAQDYCLMYRFVVVWPDKRVYNIFMSKWFKFGWLIFQQIIGIFLFILSYMGCVQPKDFQSRLLEEPMEIRMNIEKDKFFIWYDIEKSWLSLLFFGNLLSGFLLSEIVCAILIYFILSTLRVNMDKFSKNTYRLHRQFTILLAIQTASPLFFILLPITACIVSDVVFKHYPEVFITQIFYVWMSFYALSNAAFTVFFISSYRSHFFKIIRLPQLRNLLKRFKLTCCIKVIPKNTILYETQPSQVNTSNVRSYSQTLQQGQLQQLTSDR